MERKRRRFSLTVLAFVAFLVAYPISFGPVAVLCDYVEVPEPVADAMEVIYLPLFSLPEPMPHWIGEWANRWIDLVPVQVVGGDGDER
jgi:hypothetical protein